MPRIPVVTDAEATAELKPAFDAFREERGNVPNMFRTLAHRPAIMTAFRDALQAVLHTGTVPLRTKEMVVVRVSRINQCKY